MCFLVWMLIWIPNRGWARWKIQHVKTPALAVTCLVFHPLYVDKRQSSVCNQHYESNGCANREPQCRWCIWQLLQCRERSISTEIIKSSVAFCSQCGSGGCRGPACIPWPPGEARGPVPHEVPPEETSVGVLRAAGQHQEPDSRLLRGQAARPCGSAVQQWRVPQRRERSGLPQAEEELWIFPLHSLSRFQLLPPVPLHGFQYVHGG